MSFTLTREQEAKLQRKAARLGKPVEVVLNELDVPINRFSAVSEQANAG